LLMLFNFLFNNGEENRLQWNSQGMMKKVCFAG